VKTKVERAQKGAQHCYTQYKASMESLLMVSQRALDARQNTLGIITKEANNNLQIFSSVETSEDEVCREIPRTQNTIAKFYESDDEQPRQVTIHFEEEQPWKPYDYLELNQQNRNNTTITQKENKLHSRLSLDSTNHVHLQHAFLSLHEASSGNLVNASSAPRKSLTLSAQDPIHLSHAFESLGCASMGSMRELPALERAEKKGKRFTRDGDTKSRTSKFLCCFAKKAISSTRSQKANSNSRI